MGADYCCKEIYRDLYNCVFVMYNNTIQFNAYSVREKKDQRQRLSHGLDKLLDICSPSLRVLFARSLRADGNENSMGTLKKTEKNNKSRQWLSSTAARGAGRRRRRRRSSIVGGRAAVEQQVVGAKIGH